MTYTIRNAQGEAVAGDATVSQNMKDWVDDPETPGFAIFDDTTGDRVYPEEA